MFAGPVEESLGTLTDLEHRVHLISLVPLVRKSSPKMCSSGHLLFVLLFLPLGVGRGLRVIPFVRQLLFDGFLQPLEAEP